MQSTIIIATLLSLFIFIIFLLMLIKLKKTSSKIKELANSYNELEKTYFEVVSKKESEDYSDIHNENFIRFLSKSRDAAYEYIDKAQTTIKSFIDLSDKEFAYFDKYNSLLEEYPNYDTMKIMSEEYKKLRSLLPNEGQDNL
jgi:biopolymer transport protein ExbB/TolQ